MRITPSATARSGVDASHPHATRQQGLGGHAFVLPKRPQQRERRWRHQAAGTGSGMDGAKSATANAKSGDDAAKELVRGAFPLNVGTESGNTTAQSAGGAAESASNGTSAPQG